MEQDIEQHVKHRQEQHNMVQLVSMLWHSGQTWVIRKDTFPLLRIPGQTCASLIDHACPLCYVIWQEQLLRRKQDEEQVHSVNIFLQQNAIEDKKEHNERFAAIRGMVEWLKEGQDGLSKTVQQVRSWWQFQSESNLTCPCVPGWDYFWYNLGGENNIACSFLWYTLSLFCSLNSFSGQRLQQAKPRADVPFCRAWTTFGGGSADKWGWGWGALGEPSDERDRACRKTGLSNFSSGEYSCDLGG